MLSIKDIYWLDSLVTIETWLSANVTFSYLER